ncbi:hypothetical protein B0H63DRAFT_137520 [Podospora didyma]|uniref:Uncharacterized protein n=1 Tax=Podospora didyma TaxID=330526 RepID=A0AAE0NS58_9PEZI|nr:hypothetical protein B0H63DRAFT_137520 [Podospora didyma]
MRPFLLFYFPWERALALSHTPHISPLLFFCLLRSPLHSLQTLQIIACQTSCTISCPVLPCSALQLPCPVLTNPSIFANTLLNLRLHPLHTDGGQTSLLHSILPWPRRLKLYRQIRSPLCLGTSPRIRHDPLPQGSPADGSSTSRLRRGEQQLELKFQSRRCWLQTDWTCLPTCLAALALACALPCLAPPVLAPLSTCLSPRFPIRP